MFSMFVLEALVLTFMTSPVIVKLYPPKHRRRAAAIGSNFDGVEESVPEKDRDMAGGILAEQDSWKTRFTVVLDKMEHLPAIMTAAQLFRPFTLHTDKSEAFRNASASSDSATSSAQTPTTPPIIDALRLIELSDRTSAVMKSSVADSLIHTDPLLNVFRTFSELNDVPVSASLSVVPFDARAARVAEHAKENHSQLILVPWLPHTDPMMHAPGNHSVGEHYPHTPATPSGGGASSTNPFDVLFHFGITEQSSSVVHSQFVRGIFAQSSVDVALFVDRGRTGGPAAHYGKQHIFLPFFGGPDDRLALSMVVQLCGNPGTTAKVFRVVKQELVVEEPVVPELVHTADKEKHGEALVTAFQDNGLALNSVRLIIDMSPSTLLTSALLSKQPSLFLDTVYGHATTQTRLQSETADNLAWKGFASPSSSSSLSPALRAALTRIEFIELSSPTPLRDVLAQAETQYEMAIQEKARSFIVVGRARQLAVGSHHEELKELLEGNGHAVGSEVRKTMGDVATAFVVSGSTAGLVVVQAAAMSGSG